MLLSEEQVRAIYAESMKHRDPVPYIHQSIEAAVLEAQSKQEPVARQNIVARIERDGHYIRAKIFKRYMDLPAGTPLYAAPVVQPETCKEKKI